MLQKATQLSIILLGIWTIDISMAWRDFELCFSNTTCNIYETKFKTLDCAVYKSPHNLSTLSISFIPTEDIYIKDTRSKASLLRDGDKPMTLVDHIFDGCEWLEGKSTSVGLKMLITQLRLTNVTNLPYQCPLKKNKKYFIKDFYIDSEKFPPYTPHLKLDYYINFFENNKKIMHIGVEGELKSKIPVAIKKRNRK